MDYGGHKNKIKSKSENQLQLDFRVMFLYQSAD